MAACAAHASYRVVTLVFSEISSKNPKRRLRIINSTSDKIKKYRVTESETEGNGTETKIQPHCFHSSIDAKLRIMTIVLDPFSRQRLNFVLRFIITNST